MKIFKKFFLYLFFCAAGIVHGSAQDSVLVSFPNGLSAFLKLHAAEVMPSSLQQRFPMIKVWKSTHKFFPQVDFRILKVNNEWEIYAIKGDSITKFISKKDVKPINSHPKIKLKKLLLITKKIMENINQFINKINSSNRSSYLK